jgi:hypothetical protein
MLIVPVLAVPNQTLAVLLGGQSCQITLNTRGRNPRLYASLTINNTASIINNVICENGNRLVRYPYLGFVGDLMFVDSQSTFDADGNLIGQDPEYTELGSRYLLEYIEDGEG